MEDSENMDNQDIDKLALNEVAYGTQHALNTLLELLIKKNVISRSEFEKALDSGASDSFDDD